MASVRRVARSAMVAAALLSIAVPSFAERRARLSTDLADHLAAGTQSIDVIVQGDRSTVEGLASRYAVAVKRRLKSGAVLRVNAGQLDAIARDGSVDALSGDVPIRPAMAVTNTSIGADQVWDGIGGGRGLTGKGVTIAVIDSGIDGKHNALKGRVVAAVDCLQECELVQGPSDRSAWTRDARGRHHRRTAGPDGRRPNCAGRRARRISDQLASPDR